MTLLFIEEWWIPLNNAEKVFWAIALIFSVLFLMQFIVSLIGLDFDGDGDIDTGGDYNIGSNIDPGFSVLSVRGIIAFFTFFGWTGALVLKAGGATWLAITLSFSAGIAAMLIVAYLMYQFFKMSESGTVNLKKAIYKNGEVYIPIPAYKNGPGKVHIKINGTLKEIEAVTDGDAIPTGTSIKVLEVLNNGILLVEPLNANF
jgi:membrane protein implicated in regulation of membrane protease activity